MSETLNALRVDFNANYFTAGFRDMLEDHLQWLIQHPKTTPIMPQGNQITTHRNDFYGLLHSINVPVDYHWIGMRMNGLTSPHEYKGEYIPIIVPDQTVIDDLLARYMQSAG